MKNTQKGFIVPLLIAIIAVLAIGGGVYVYENKKAEAPVSVNDNQNSQNNTSTSNPQTVTNMQVTTTQNNVSNNPKVTPTSTKISEWKMYTNSANGFSLKYPPTWTVDLENIGVVKVRLLDSKTPVKEGTDQPANRVLIRKMSDSGEVRSDSGWGVGFAGINWRSIRDATHDSDIIMSALTTDAQKIEDQIYSTLTFEKVVQKPSLQVYNNTHYGYQIQYPSDFTKNQNTNDNSSPSLEIIYPNSYAAGTNLTNAFISVETQSTDEKTCYARNAAGLPLTINSELGQPISMTINGVNFRTGHTGDSATGHYGYESFLSTYHNNLCYTISVSAVGAKQCFADAPDGPSCKNPLPSFNLDTQILPTFLQIANTFKFLVIAGL